MSGLAEILLLRGVSVSGSDLAPNKKTAELEALGASIFIGHDAKHVEGSDVVVYSSAAASDNIERNAAATLGIRQVRRAEFMAELLKEHTVIAVAGTHGKTTVTSMIASIFIEARLDPLVLVGASVPELGNKNSRAGSGKIAIVEADEFDRSFLALSPFLAVMTTLEAEHLDIYGTIESLKDAFVEFANQGPSNGYAIVCLDETVLREITPRLKKRIVSYGIHSPEAKYRARDISIARSKTRATVLRGSEVIGELELRVPGEHNIKNALAAIAVADAFAIPLERSIHALKRFGGAERRFQTIGEAGRTVVIDDYAHHPTEVRATLATARALYPEQRIVACFQPHTFTRTRDFAEMFGEVLASMANVTVLLDIYPAREEPIEGVTSRLIAEAARSAGIKELHETRMPSDLPNVLRGIVQEGDVILTMGAGPITDAAPKIVEMLNERMPVSAQEIDSAV